MSRSHRKRQYDKCKTKAAPFFKKLYNRRLRKIPEIGNGGRYRKFNESSNIWEYSYNVSWEAFCSWDWVKEKDWTEEEKRAWWKANCRSK